MASQRTTTPRLDRSCSGGYGYVSALGVRVLISHPGHGKIMGQDNGVGYRSGFSEPSSRGRRSSQGRAFAADRRAGSDPGGRRLPWCFCQWAWVGPVEAVGRNVRSSMAEALSRDALPPSGQAYLRHSQPPLLPSGLAGSAIVAPATRPEASATASATVEEGQASRPAWRYPARPSVCGTACHMEVTKWR